MKKLFFSTESIVILMIINILVISTALKPDFLQSLETTSYDFSMNKNRQTTNTHDRIAIILIDKYSVNQFGAWPWERSIIANVLDKLTIAKAKTIGLQFPLMKGKNQTLDEFNKLKTYIENNKGIKRKQARKLKKLLHLAEQELDTDGRLSKSIFKAPNLILSMTSQNTYSGNITIQPDFINKIRLKSNKNNQNNTHIKNIPEISFPLGIFAKNARGVGHNNFIVDHDGAVRSQPLVLKYKDNYFSSFSLLLAARSQGIPLTSIRLTEKGIKLGKRAITTNAQKKFYPTFLSINSNKTTFKSYSFYDVLNGDVALKNFKNKIVIIGLSDINLSNKYATPIGDIYSPFINANIITSLIDQRYFTKPDWAQSFELIVFISVLLYLFLVIPNFRTSITLLTSLFLATILIAMNQYFLIVEHVWIKTVTATFILIFGHVLFVIYHHLSKGKRQFITDSSDTTKMLVTTLQSQGQIDTAMEKLRNIPKIDSSVLGLAYGIAQDYESKRQFGKALSVYDYILHHDKKFRDTAKRRERAASIDGAVLLHSSSIITDVIDTMPKLGHYEVAKEIGRGAMGVVYLGRDSKIDRSVAIKTLALSEEFGGNDLENVTKRFFKEARVAGKLNHPNIVTVYDAGQEHDLTWMAMEYLDGHDLTHYIQSKKKPKIDWVLDIIWHVAGALDYAHDAGIVHRDIKPANIMFMPEDETIKIMDFGIARVADSNTTKTGTALGTPSYMSPEQISGEKVKGSSDFFSLGVTMYELLTGELPFQGDSLPAMIYQITTKRHPSIMNLRKRLPTCVKTIVDKLLQKDPKKRYPDGASLQEAIERCMKR